MRFGRYVCLLALLIFPCFAAHAQSEKTSLTASGLFDFAQRLAEGGDLEAAYAAYTALAKDPDIEVRAEARFRHGQLLETQRRFKDAALLYRAILDEKPDAQRVRLELAKVLALMGDGIGARRALRQAQAGQLPPEIAQIVNQYAAALNAYKPLNMSLELALAPTTNINRATNARTLDTIIAPFDLSDDARAQSGLGVRIGGQVSAKLPLLSKVQAIARISAQSNLYRDEQFDDAVAAGQIGFEALLGKTTRVRPQFGRSYRWYGHSLYATTNSVSLNVTRPLGNRTQLEIEASAGWADYRSNDLQDGQIFDASMTVEHAFSPKMGGSLSLSGQRQTATDPGYATTSGGANLLLWREWGKATVFGTAGLYRLEADARLGLFLDRRKEWLLRSGLGATLRHIKIAGFAPVLRLNYDRNISTVGIYDYSRFAGELGITRAF
jgi:outer membrane protein